MTRVGTSHSSMGLQPDAAVPVELAERDEAVAARLEPGEKQVEGRYRSALIAATVVEQDDVAGADPSEDPRNGVLWRLVRPMVEALVPQHGPRLGRTVRARARNGRRARFG